MRMIRKGGQKGDLSLVLVFCSVTRCVMQSGMDSALRHVGAGTALKALRRAQEVADREEMLRQAREGRHVRDPARGAAVRRLVAR
jgi:hypothetical protein